VTHIGCAPKPRVVDDDAGDFHLQLETEDGLAVFVTEAGKDLRGSCTMIIEEIADIERRLAGKDQRPEGRVAITYPDGFASHVIAGVAKLGKLYPDISIVHVNREEFVALDSREA